MDIKKNTSSEQNEVGKEETYSIRVKTKNGLVLLTNLKLTGEVPEEGFALYNDNEFDYGERLE